MKALNIEDLITTNRRVKVLKIELINLIDVLPYDKHSVKDVVISLVEKW